MKNHMYSTNKLHKPYSMRSKKNHRVLGGLTSNSLLGVKWRFLQENSNEAYRADVHKPIPSHKYSHASFSRRRTPQARQHHHHTSESDHAKPHDIQGLSKGAPTTSPSQDAHSFSFVSLLEKNQEEEKAKARAGDALDFEIHGLASSRAMEEQKKREFEKYEADLQNLDEEVSAINAQTLGRLYAAKSGKDNARTHHEQDGDKDNDMAESRSPSPVIIWRPTARVKLATDLPSELRSVFMGEDSAGQHNSNSNSNSNSSSSDHASSGAGAGFERDMTRIDLQHRSLRPHPRTKSGDRGHGEGAGKKKRRRYKNKSGHSNSNTGGGNSTSSTSTNNRNGHGHQKKDPMLRQVVGCISSFNYKPKPKRRVVKYGAWYIPPKHWRAQSFSTEGLAAHENDDDDGGARADDAVSSFFDTLHQRAAASASKPSSAADEGSDDNDNGMNESPNDSGGRHASTRSRGGGEGGSNRHYSGGSRGGRGRRRKKTDNNDDDDDDYTAIVRKAQELKTQIPKLYISKAYKKFIAGHTNSYVPYYLKGVDLDVDDGGNTKYTRSNDDLHVHDKERKAVLKNSAASMMMTGSQR